MNLWRPFTVIVAVLGVLVVVVLLLGAANTVASGYDFAAYVNAATRFLATGSPYQPETVNGPFSAGPFGLFLYTPIVAVLFVPFTALQLDVATQLWLVARIALFVLTCALLPVRRDVKLAVFGVGMLSFPVVRDLLLGNVSLVVTFLAVVVWRWLDTPLAGIATALATFIRPQLGLVAIWALARRQTRMFVAAVLTGLVVIAISVPLVGVNGWIDYVSVLRNMNTSDAARSSDLSSVAAQLGLSQPLPAIALIAGIALALGTVAWSLRRDRETSFVVTVMATLLLSPLLWDHYLTYLILPAALLAARGARWGIFLPLLAWLPLPALPFVVTAGMLAPLLVTDGVASHPEPQRVVLKP